MMAPVAKSLTHLLTADCSTRGFISNFGRQLVVLLVLRKGRYVKEEREREFYFELLLAKEGQPDPPTYQCNCYIFVQLMTENKVNDDDDGEKQR